mmetsp:Transcript_3816/g.7791  ORF Transcript_3816/g.7791 Transcript_3816/m.7791 type:complete len:93 (+) Transcript_3816:1-279(+)
MRWRDGRQYAGQYRDNKKHGHGSFCWPDGRRYEGQWIEGKRHGRGSYTNAKGEQGVGDWSQDKPMHWLPRSEQVAKPADQPPILLEENVVTS